MPPTDNTRRRSTLVKITLLAVAVLALYGALTSYQLSAENSRRFPDTYGAERAAIRLAPLLPLVPRNAECGYFTDLPPNSAGANLAFLTAQFVLAPRLLLPVGVGTAPARAIGNFSAPQDFAAAGAAHGYLMEADLGNGVVLYRRADAH